MQIELGPLIVLIELLLSDFIFLIYQKKRRFFPLRILICGVLCVIFLMVWSAHYALELEMINYFFLFSITLFCMFFCFQLSFWDTLYWGVSGIIIQHAGYSICNICWTLDQQNKHSFLYIYITYVLLYFLEYYFITRKYRGEYHPKDNYKTLVLLSSLVIFTTIFLNSFRANYSSGSDYNLNIIVFIYSLICCFFALILQLGLFDKFRLQNELDIVNQLWHNDQKQYKTSKQNVDLLNMYCHDLKHLIHSMEENNCIDDFKTEVSNALKLFDSTITTNNHALDVILTEKSLYCQQHQIALTCMADGEQLNCIQTTDLYSIFGNLINNAIEAVVQIDNPQKRIISLIVSRKNNFLYIHIENYFENKLDFVNGLPRSIKTNTTFHGYGLKSVKLMVEKYNGNMAIETTGDIFYINIIIPTIS